MCISSKRHIVGKAISLLSAQTAGTADVVPYKFKHGEYEITLIDTPGFNDTYRSETEVLRDIADWLEYTYRIPPHIKLTGIIYLQALTDRKMYGSSVRNLKMFRDLCGEKPLENVLLATTGWGVAKKAGQMDQATDKEEELRRDPDFWKPMIRRGATMCRFEDSRDSALQMIMGLVGKNPTVLQIQEELVDEGKNLSETAAGTTVNEELKRLQEKYQQELEKVQEEMQEALAARDEEMQDILRDSQRRLERLREENRQAQDMLHYERRNEVRRMQNDMDSMRREMERKMEAQRLEDEMKFEGIVAQLRRYQHKVRPEQQKVIDESIRKAEKSSSKTGKGVKLLLNLLPILGSVAMSLLGFPLFLGNPFGSISSLFEEN